MLERIKKQGQEKVKKETEALHQHYAVKLQHMQAENDETLVKLQKDFVRDIIEDLKNVAQEVRYAIGGESEEDALEEKK